MKFSWTTTDLQEGILSLLALFWGGVMVLPGNVFAQPTDLRPLSLYAQDWVWGSLLLLMSLLFVALNRYRYIIWRRFYHAFYWTFWSGIAFVAGIRVMNATTITPALFLIPSAFLAIALIHAVIYIGLWRKL